MKQVQQDFGSGELRLSDVPNPAVKPEGVLVRTHHSAVSAGTESSMINLAKKSLVGKAKERPDLVKEVLNKARNDGLVATYQSVTSRLDDPMPLGYSCAGEIIAVGKNVEQFSVGDQVACGGAGYATHSEVNYVPENLCVPLPKDVSSADGAFVTLGAIAMQGIRRLDLSPGETVAVIGLGLIGHLTVGILDAYGYPVLGTDIDSSRVARANDYGLTTGIVLGEGDPKTAAKDLGPSEGVDAVLIAASTDSNDPVELAGDLCREQGRVSVVGQVGMDIPREVYYDKELDVRISRSYGPGRYDRIYEEKGLDYPVGHVRWTENRNMQEFVRLLSDRLSVAPLVTHRFDIEEASKAYDVILGDESPLGVLLEYEHDELLDDRIDLPRSSRPSKRSTAETLSVGLVGAGNFAKQSLLPVVDNSNEFSLHAVVTGTGKTAKHIGEKYGARYCTTNYEEILNDEAIDVVVVATRHNLHAPVAVGALERGKDVHVEKPPALDREELTKVVAAEQNSAGRLMVGYNRRFAPSSKRVQAAFSRSETPLMMNYRVNADRIPADHWIHDPAVGGGRVVGEICHFVDFSQAVTDSLPKRVYATEVDRGEDTNVQVTIDFMDDSVASILYTTLGDESAAKERVEVFGNGDIETIENFKPGFLNLTQEKGHKEEFEAFAEAIRQGDPSPIGIKDIVYTSLSTFAVEESIQSGKPVFLDPDTVFPPLE